ncbi:MAG: SMC-Scp complex subunit ScpB [Candidatus Brennerbacteria bacterium]|nr:SMC-Scp complex subunit ScpB [Candidatus Brennerbacteria bacterium]
MDDIKNDDKIKKNAAALEALLFIYGEPLAISKAASILKNGVDELETAADYLTESLKSGERGLELLRVNDNVQLGTKPDFSGTLEQLIKEDMKENLTPAALETVSLIAYGGPMPRSTIDYIRGVNSSFILRNLLMRGLVERSVDHKKTNVYLYRASFDFLKHINLPKPDDLPEYQKYRELLKQTMQ